MLVGLPSLPPPKMTPVLTNLTVTKSLLGAFPATSRISCILFMPDGLTRHLSVFFHADDRQCILFNSCTIYAANCTNCARAHTKNALPNNIWSFLMLRTLRCRQCSQQNENHRIPRTILVAGSVFAMNVRRQRVTNEVVRCCFIIHSLFAADKWMLTNRLPDAAFVSVDFSFFLRA